MSSIHSISISAKKGMRKANVEKANFINNFGIESDAHGDSSWHRQISLLAIESINTMVAKGLDVKSGDFAENVTTQNIDLLAFPVGTRLIVNGIDMTISQIGKVCHNKCAIYYQAGDCVMPKEGIFAVVNSGGEMKVGDSIEVIPKKAISIGIITLSDKGSKGQRIDETGPALVKYVTEKLNPSFVRLDMIPDDTDKLEMYLKDFADTQNFDIIITDGSTGVSTRDIAPDVTLPLLDRRLPGFEEAMRMESYKLTKRALISRAVVGIRGKALIINLPGSVKAAVENLSFIVDALQHTIDKINDDPSDCGTV